jgi:hypothetical protein
MATALRIPGLVDIVVCTSVADIAAMAAEPALDRNFRPTGPLLNRILARRIRRVLALDGRPLPSVAPRESAGRAESQAALDSVLTSRAGEAPCNAETLDKLAGLVLRRAEATDFGPVAQTAVGRLFQPSFAGTAQTWQAALVLEAAVRSFNPLRRLRWLFNGEVEAAQAELAVAMQGDAAALHGIGVAIHNIVASFFRMGALAASTDAFERIGSEAAASRCLTAPARVLRQVDGVMHGPQGSFRAGALVVLNLETARSRTLRRDIAFLNGTWSACPAHAWVPALLAAVWTRARGLHGAAVDERSIHGI